VNRNLWYPAILLACLSTAASADDRDDYNRRSTERFVALFRAADINKDNVVSREEAEGTIELVNRFNDIDVSRDGFITWDEMTLFVVGNFR
jgi:Ca2+-binding EF-hand superfamily protein